MASREAGSTVASPRVVRSCRSRRSCHPSRSVQTTAITMSTGTPRDYSWELRKSSRPHRLVVGPIGAACHRQLAAGRPRHVTQQWEVVIVHAWVAASKRLSCYAPAPANGGMEEPRSGSYTDDVAIVSGIVSRPRGRRLPPAIFWITCFAIVPLALSGLPPWWCI